MNTISRSAQAFFIAAAAVLIIARLYVPVPPIRTEHTPIEALAALPTSLTAQPVLNDYDLGGYLIGQNIRPFIDGRTDMYGPQYLARYNAIMRDREALTTALKDYDIRWTLLRRGSAAVAHMDTMPHWQRLYGDDQFVVHIRKP